MRVGEGLNRNGFLTMVKKNKLTKVKIIGRERKREFYIYIYIFYYYY